ncbi:polysaccharide deacetylase family protein [Treponema sp.]|uniref:polysaccharide deacetylase family protein n=1 Tax=Treponema sp. TaxID=166 RepID=UPI00298DD411|nr:polysaccharide deacetylase family protein [Treponema sp.]MCQ2241812.1 polysaccharide deacetylase family protein [Treponema sp.]
MKNKYLLNYLLGTIILVSATSVYAGVRLDDIDVGTDDRLLFTAEQKIPGVAEYKSLYCTKLGDEKIKSAPVLLTCFPERMELLDEGKILQVRNIDGLSRFSTEEGKITRISDGKREKIIRTFPVSASPDGKWYCTVEPVRKASGNLILVNSKTLLQKTLIENVDLDYSSVKVKWAPDGKALLYENNGGVYFSTPDAVFKNLQVNESFRKIGEGSIDSVQWTQTKKIIYLKDDVVYSIEQNELYTRGLYSTLVGNGKIIARLPVEFNCLSDKFWCNGSGSRIAVISRGNILSLYSVSGDEKNKFAKIDLICPLTEVSGTSLGYELFWNGEGKALLWNDCLDYTTNERTGTLYSVESEMQVLAAAKKSINPILSPDSKKIVYTDRGVLKVFDITSMTETASFNKEPVISAVWAGRSGLYVGGRNTVSFLNLVSQESKVLFLSSAESAYWYAGFIVTSIPGENGYYCYDSERNIWVEYKIPDVILKANDRNGKYRAYVGKATNQKYENTIFVRSLAGKTNTYSIFPDSIIECDDVKRVALAFDAMENAEGLGKVLNTISEYGVKGTFFVNGEFIRRYPEKTRLIASSGNDCGSLFYTAADLVENNFMIDSSFITRGLARNEDEYFSVAHRELSLLWHAPYYHDTELIRMSGTAAGYEYVSAFAKFTDRTTYERSYAKKEEYKSAAEIINGLTEVLEDGMIIPVCIGKANGTRKDYVYEKLDVLISSILECGYEITDVQGLK